MPGTVLVLHAHPDDEAIFTGGTIALLADAGWRVVLVVATSGEAGQPLADEGPGALGRTRRRETVRAASILGVARTVFLGHADSGIDGRRLPGAFADQDPETVAWAVASVAVDERAQALVTYDEGGIYPHPDHLMVHAVGRRAAALAGIATWYEATVDREHLHFVDTHLVGDAAASLPTDASFGVPSVMVSTTVDVRSVLARKRAAIEAHASQIPDQWGPLAMLPDAFAATYGFEWFVRNGPAGPVETLPQPGPSVRGRTDGLVTISPMP